MNKKLQFRKFSLFITLSLNLTQTGLAQTWHLTSHSLSLVLLSTSLKHYLFSQSNVLWELNAPQLKHRQSNKTKQIMKTSSWIRQDEHSKYTPRNQIQTLLRVSKGKRVTTSWKYVCCFHSLGLVKWLQKNHPCGWVVCNCFCTCFFLCALLMLCIYILLSLHLFEWVNTLQVLCLEPSQPPHKPTYYSEI